MVGNNTEQMISISINAELDSLDTISALFNGVEEGNSIEYGNGEARLELHSVSDSFSFSGDIEVNLIASFAVGVASGVVGNMIYNAICDGIKKLEINGRRTRISEESITEAIETIRELVSLSKETNKTKEQKK